MGVILFRLGKVIVHDVLYVGNVESAASEVRAHQDIGAAVGKAVDGFLALPLVEAAMIGRNGEAFVRQKSRRALHAVPVIEKDDGAIALEATEQRCEDRELVFVGTVDDVHLDAVFLLGVLAEVDDLKAGGRERRVDELIRRDIGGREEDAARRTGQAAHRLVHLVGEAHLKTFVELVDDDESHVAGLDIPFVDMVVEASGRSDDDLRLDFPQFAVLVHRRSAAVTGITP